MVLVWPDRADPADAIYVIVCDMLVIVVEESTGLAGSEHSRAAPRHRRCAATAPAAEVRVRVPAHFWDSPDMLNGGACC